MKKVIYTDYAKEALEHLQKGAFLCVSNAELDNVMTISWGSIGNYWGKAHFMILVRYSRHTYKMLEDSKQFSISIPLNSNLKDALAKCGKLSGRDTNKWQEANLTKIDAHEVNSKLVGECELHFECKVVARMPFEKEKIVETKIENFYNNGDYHVLYYGEILGTYLDKKGDVII
ncbi:hypothetical protein AN641_08010 [Candidatus Epulonipiscioides gigas]|nr:hypothetical protein AN641_08010 [Epulopiscium sp. SCG-C07WGA-EpuloA2]